MLGCGLAVASLYPLQTHFEDIEYSKYRENYPYQSRNLVVEKYKKLKVDEF